MGIFQKSFESDINCIMLTNGISLFRELATKLGSFSSTINWLKALPLCLHDGSAVSTHVSEKVVCNTQPTVVTNLHICSTFQGNLSPPPRYT